MATASVLTDMRKDDRSGFSRIPTNAEPAAITRSACMRQAEVTFWILAWYSMSICITIFNKYLFTSYGLHFPLSVTSLHFCLKLVFARIAMRCAGIPPLDLCRTWRLVATVAANGLATAADVALSNQAFLFISVTYYTIVKSSVPVWILVFSVRRSPALDRRTASQARSSAMLPLLLRSATASSVPRQSSSGS